MRKVVLTAIALSAVVAGQTLDTTLASVSAPTNPSGSFVNLDGAPETTVCTQASGDGCVQSQQYRSLGQARPYARAANVID